MKKIIKKIKNIFYRCSDKKLTYPEVKNIIKSNENVVLVDVRSSQEYREGHLSNAINIPVYDFESSVASKIQDKNSIIILYCQTETRSTKAKKILVKMGYVNIYILKKGLDGIA